MSSLPRIVTVDPTGTIARIVRAAVDLVDRPVVIADVPTGPQALEEVGHGGCSMVITAWDLNDDMRGLELALRAKQSSPDTNVMILADVDDPEELDEETLAESPFVYMSRPVDPQQFLRVLMAGMAGDDIRDAMKAPTAPAATKFDMGPVPMLDLEAAKSIVDGLLTDLGAMAIVFSSRVGEVLMERGAVGYLDREHLTTALLPAVTTNVDVKELVGGNASALIFYDGDDYDIFVLTVGLHHFMCVAFPGESGQKQFGAVSRYGRRAAEDLIALLGANAWMVQRVVVEEEERPKRKQKPAKVEEEEAPLVRAEVLFETEEEAEPEPVLPQLEPIQDLDLAIFDDLEALDVSEADDLFDPEKMEELASQQRKSGSIDFDQAQELGIFPKV